MANRFADHLNSLYLETIIKKHEDLYRTSDGFKPYLFVLFGDGFEGEE